MRDTMAHSEKEITKSRIAWAIAYLLAFLWLLIALLFQKVFVVKEDY